MPANRLILQVAFQGPSGIPRDQFENVWHWTGIDADIANDAYSATARMAGFYGLVGVGGGFSVGAIMTPAMGRSVQVKVYDEDEVRPPGAPRTILQTNHFTIPDASSPQGLPEQIALCVSYFAVSNLAGNRGRLYIGPWNVSALEEDVNPRPAANLLSVMRQQAETTGTSELPTAPELALVTTPPAGYAPTAVQWAHRSGKGGAGGTAGTVLYRSVTGGWIDNEWDGQRRRRISASARVTFL